MIKHLPDNHSNNFIKLRNSLISATGKAIGDYNMIENNDTVLVCMSGGAKHYVSNAECVAFLFTRYQD